MINPDFSTLWEHPLFSILLPNQKEWLSNRITAKVFPPRTSIYEDSDSGSPCFYFLLEGKIKVETSFPSGSRFIKKICLTGEIFGFRGFSTPHPMTESVHPLRTKVTVASIDCRDIKRLAEVNHEFAQGLMHLIWRELIFFEKRTAKLVDLSARERFADFIVEMTEKEGVFTNGEWLFNSQLTQAEIGAYIGTGRQTVTEILNDFREKNILRYTWGRFFVKDLAALKS